MKPSDAHKESHENLENALLITFLRTDYIEQTLESLASASVKNLFVWIDGPRNESERGIQNEIKELINSRNLNFIKVKISHQNSNLGLNTSVISAVDWFFSECASGLILEDDLLISPEFFNYLADNLAIFQTQEKSLLISGNNPLPNNLGKGHKLINYPLIWGWYTNAQKWQIIRELIKSVEDVQNNLLPYHVKQFWKAGKIRVNLGDVKSWALPFAYGMRMLGYVSINPHVNLISNLGDDEVATHTSNNSPMMRFRNGKYNSDREIDCICRIDEDLNRFLEEKVYLIRRYHIISPVLAKLRISR